MVPGREKPDAVTALLEEVTHREQPQLAMSKSDLHGRCAIVTGAATGIGRATALELARRGCAVAFNYVELPGRDVAVQAAMTEAVLKSLNVPVYCDRCDVRSFADVEKFVRAAKEAIGGVHILVNNAGISRDAALWKTDDSAWRDVVDTNLTGAFNMIKSVAPTFRGQHYGKIVNVSSIMAVKPGFGVANYAASKAGLIGLTHAAAVELGPANVNVNAVAPGFVKTELTGHLFDELSARARAQTTLGRVAEPDDVAQIIVFLCTDASRHITGEVIRVDGGQALS
ncbi:MAG TPA: 3-oxoacyl-ACP reductase family protein [Gemmatimonadales bacterium]|jgi:3-oxoacyl-[acyl-carrier protein] reductase